MTIGKWGPAAICLLGVGVYAGTGLAQRAPAGAVLQPVSAHAAQASQAVPKGPNAPAASLDPDSVVSQFCTGCHNEKSLKGQLSLTEFKLASITDKPYIGEKMIRKLQAGMMPPPGAKRPDAASLIGLATAIEGKLDAAYAAQPNPGGRVFQRLNRPEYASAIKDLLGLEVEAGSWLPLDQKSANFDNIADEQVLSPTLLEAFLNAAGDISRMAIGDRTATPADRTYTNTSYLSQHPWDHVDGAPYGSRGGMVLKPVFPVDAEYVFEVTFTGGDNTRLEDVDVSIDGTRVALVRYETGQAGAADGRGAVPVKTEPILVKAGQHLVAAAFVRKFDGPYEDLIRPHDWSFAGGGSGGTGITTLPHLRDVIIHGPYKPTGISDTVSRQKIFTCRPTVQTEEKSCARTIVSHLGSEAYRRPLSSREVDGIMQFYDIGSSKGGFEGGVRNALEAILTSPYFI